MSKTGHTSLFCIISIQSGESGSQPSSLLLRINSENVTIPIILTLLSEDGGSDKILMSVVTALATIGAETYSLTLSDIQVDRFGI